MTIKEVLMKRDGLSEKDAENEVVEFKESIEDYIENGDYDGIEDALMNDLGLEPDYIMELLW